METSGDNTTPATCPKPAWRFSRAVREDQVGEDAEGAVAEHQAGWAYPKEKGIACSLPRKQKGKKEKKKKQVQERIHLCLWPLVYTNSTVVVYFLIAVTSCLT